MAQQPVISVRGEAWLEAEPEIAVISVTVQARVRQPVTAHVDARFAIVLPGQPPP